MASADGCPRNSSKLLAVLCGGRLGSKGGRHRSPHPFWEPISSGRLEVQTLVNPTVDEFRDAQKSLTPNFLYLQGERQLENWEEIGNLIWGFNDVSDPELFTSLVGPSLPTIVYLEVPNSERIAQALHSKGVPYVIYWRNTFSSYAASHFCQALLSVIQSSYSHMWDAYQLAHASYRLYCALNTRVMPVSCQGVNNKLGPHLLGDAPKINTPLGEKDPDEEIEVVVEEEDSTSSSLKVHEGEVDMGFLVCGVPCMLDACLLGSLEDGLSALLNIEIRGSRLINRVSAAPPPQAGLLSREILTVRCDLITCTSAHISLLVSGSAQMCFNDELLECHIKNELIKKSHLVHALPKNEDNRTSFSQPLNSVSIACGASVFEVWMKVPNWGIQVLRQLAPVASYRTLVALGIASIQSIPVASFEKEDADHLLFYQKKREDSSEDPTYCVLPSSSPCPTIKRSSLETFSDRKATNNSGLPLGQMLRFVGRNCISSTSHKLKSTMLRPIPHIRPREMAPSSTIHTSNTIDVSQVMLGLPSFPPAKSLVPLAQARRKPTPSSLRAQKMISPNPVPMKKHECERPPIRICSEEVFLKDVVKFLIQRGNSRYVPKGGASKFPDAILNGKRLDLYNLYREVVSRGGFYVGNGINWKGQVFSKMRNHTATNRMTGVGNALKRHYETYLLEYELAHDDVDGECCLLCHSCTPGDWVNCGLCREWAHFGCDRRQGLGSFKDYAKTDGLEYICPRCSLTRKAQKTANGFSHTIPVLQNV